MNSLRLQAARTESLVGYSIFAGQLAECIAQIVDVLSGGGCAWLACMNPHSYVSALNREEFSAALKSADWLVPDGFGIVIASRLIGGRIRERITGSDIFFRLHDELQLLGGATVFLLGATDDTLSVMASRIEAQWPAIRVIGRHAPPFRTQFSLTEINDMVARINQVSPDILWVGLSAPKQEELIHRILPRLNVRFAAAVGAVFDFYTGRVRRSGLVFQRFGLEWLPRLIQEPRRLWRRMFISAPVFMSHVVRQKFARRNV